MVLYTNHSLYENFGHFVSVVNISLQLYLASLVMPLSIGMIHQLIVVVAACLATDFINGLVHMYMDCNDSYDSLAGPLTANFHLHHKAPQYDINPLPIVYFRESGSKVWLVGYLLIVAFALNKMPTSPQLAYLLVYIGIFSSVAEVSHYLCHSSNSNMILFLGNCGVLLSKRHHARHHLEDNTNYAFLNGWSDPLLNMIARYFSPGYKNTTDRHYAHYERNETGRRG